MTTESSGRPKGDEACLASQITSFALRREGFLDTLKRQLPRHILMMLQMLVCLEVQMGYGSCIQKHSGNDCAR